VIGVLADNSAYRPVAASALASNSFMRSAFAAGFPLYVTIFQEQTNHELTPDSASKCTAA